jgi:hypothetical protein
MRERALKAIWPDLPRKTPRTAPSPTPPDKIYYTVTAPKFRRIAVLLILAFLHGAFTASAEDPGNAKTTTPDTKQTLGTQPASVVTVNPQNAVRGAVVTVTLTAPPKDAKTVEVLLDAIHVSVPNPYPNGTYRVQIPADSKPDSPGFVPLGKHRVSVVVDGEWFTGNEFVDVDRPEPAPKLTSISPKYLVDGSADRTLTLTGNNFATDIQEDNQILFDDIVEPVIWGGCPPPTGSKSEEKPIIYGKVVDRFTITLCNVHLPEKNSVEVNVRQGEHDTASGLRLTISHLGESSIILWSFGVVLTCVALVFFLAYFARKYRIGDTRYGMWSILFLDLETKTFSLSKLQFYLWTGAAILTYTYLVIGRLFVQRLDFPDVPSSLPGIIAIGAGTLIGSQFVTNVRGPKGGGPEKPGLGDFVTSGGVAAPDRVQMLVWTLVGVIGFCVATFLIEPWTISALPKIGDSLMLLMGISSAGYLGGKLARKPGPVLNEISLSPSGPDDNQAGVATVPAATADLSQPISAAQQVYSRATAAIGQPTQNLSANALSAAQNALGALKAALDAAKAAKADVLSMLTDSAATADVASRILATDYSDMVSTEADAIKIEATRQAAELAQQVASSAQDLASGVSQAIGIAQAQAQPSANSTPLRGIELRGRNLSSNATFEINGTELPLRMLADVKGIQAPEIASPEDDAGATTMARALRLKIDPSALGPSDRATYNSWFKTGGKDLEFTISNPDGQISEITVKLPPGTQQAHT